MPDAKSTIREIAYKDPTPEIFGSQGEFSPERWKVIIHQLEEQAGSTDLLNRQIPPMGSIRDLPLVEGNRVHLIMDGPTTYTAMFPAMGGANFT